MKTIETIDDRPETIDKGIACRRPFFFIFSFCLLSMVYSLSSQAADQKPAAPAAAPVTPSPAPAAESEKSKDWNGLQAQEQWVARLEKQISGETRQLAEMRAKVAAKYKLDVKGFEAGIYDYDKEKDAFVER